MSEQTVLDAAGQEDLRTLLQTSWLRRRRPPSPRSEGSPEGEGGGLRRRLFERVLRSVETSGGG
ncbi:MAG: hypothetical protein ABI779_27005, partial [Acidobacteriota bacterium]